MNPSEDLKQIIEAALLAAGRTMSLEAMMNLFDDMEQPDRKDLRQILVELSADYAERGIEVKEVSTGWRIQVRKECSPWVSRLWDEKPGRYSRALMETLALIAYRQPITRGEIEEIRGVGVSTNIIKTLLEREWVRVVGQRDVPGRPSLYSTTREFLDYFSLQSLDELPTLAEIRDLDSINKELDLVEQGAAANDEPQTEDREDGDTTDSSATVIAGDTAEESAEPSGDVTGTGGMDMPATGEVAASADVSPGEETASADSSKDSANGN